MSLRFVRPEYDVLTLASGDTITVKRRLTAGEEREYYKRASTKDAEGRLTVDRIERPIALVLAYLVDWSVTDDQAQLIPIRHAATEELRAVLDNLDPDDFREIAAAIDAHGQRMTADREAQKKTPSGSNGSGATSASPAAAAGATSGSPNWTPTSTTSSSPN